MNRLNDLWKRYFTQRQPLPAGMYHYQSPADAPTPYRLHLRLEPSGEGLLIVNASTVLHLNQTAAEFAYYLVQGKTDDEAVAEISTRYRVNKQQAGQDFQELKTKLSTLVSAEDLDPVTYLDFERITPHSADLSAPLRIDCALTYQTSDGDPFNAPITRVRRELLTEEWEQILDKAWQGGIPHVIFTGGEPTLRPDLDELIAYGEKLGMVTGLLTDGLRLTDYEYFHKLLNNGLDHLTLLLNPAEEESWEAVRHAVNEDIFTTVHLTITHDNLEQIESVLNKLVGIGVKTLSISTNEAALKEQMKSIQQAVADRALSLVWDLPVPYSSFHPVTVELAEHGELPSGAGKAWLYVEPDGDVLPGQGSALVLGNLLIEPWEKIWKH